MLFKRIYDDDLAQASYLIACQEAGTAVVVDPRRDIDVYLQEAEASDVRIVAVTETHIHADYLSGARELAQATGAELHLSDEGGTEWEYRFPHLGLVDGSEIRIGNIVLSAVHTPGHTPEHLSFLVTDGAASDRPGYLLTGDFVFVGDLGRPDLLDEAAGGTDTRYPMARQLFRSLVDRFATLPDYVQVWPGHGAGSACGKALGAMDSTTVGYEKLVSWWAAYVESGDEEGFVEALLAGQPDAPHYFARMKRWNRQGPALLGDLPPLREYSPEELRREAEEGSAVVVDARARAAFARGHLSGSLNVPAGRRFATYAAWVLDPERGPRAVILAGVDESKAQELRDKLLRIGVDEVIGYVSHLSSLATATVRTVEPQKLPQIADPVILDVRSSAEFEGGAVPGSVHIHGGRVMWQQERLSKGLPIVIYCQSGARSAVVGSALRAEGFDVSELRGSFDRWQETMPVGAGVHGVTG